MKKKLYALLAVLALVFALLAGVIVGNTVTRRAAVLVADCADSYIISYRFGSYWQNEFYEK